MGLGRYDSGKFDLVLSVRHNADATRLEQWERSFRRASEMLYDATDGQMQFGRLYVANDSRGTAEADAFLEEADGGSWTTIPIPGLGTTDLHCILMGDERRKPFIVLHEFAHYAFSVWDEYEDPTQCTNDTSTGACVMEWGWPEGDQIADDGTLTVGQISEFCTATNHDPDGGTEQEAFNGESCWETMTDEFADLTAPSGLPGGPAPGGHDDVEWILLADASRFSLVLDRSGSMAVGNAIAGVRFGADYWVQYLAQTGDELSVVQYNHGVDDILDHTLLTAATDLAPTLDAIAGITPSGLTNIGGALARGREQILSPGSQAATQVLVLFSDGLHNSGPDPATVVPDLVGSGIRVYTIGFGPGADQLLLEAIAQDTGGRFEQIDAAPDSPAAQLEIQNYLIEVSGEVRDGSGIVTMAPGLLGEPPEAEADEAPAAEERYGKEYLETIKRRPFHFGARPKGADHRAWIEKGSRLATFVVSHLLRTEVTLHLVRPDGSVVDPGTDPSVALVDPKGVPYTFYTVRDPMPGMWVMRVSRAQRRGVIPYKIFAFSENPDVRLAVTGLRRRNPGLVSIGIQPVGVGELVGTNAPKVTTFDSARVGGWHPRPCRVKVVPGVTSFGRCGRVRHAPKVGFTGEFIANQPGSYPVQVEVVNAGTAREAMTLIEPLQPGDRVAPVPDPPPFARTRRLQVHVGPLPRGLDLESGGGERP